MKKIAGGLCLLIVLAISCKNGTQVPSKAVSVKDTANQHIKYPDTPDFAAHLAPLLAFFERNKAQTTFDTDISYEDQGFGGPDNYYNFIHAGHIFCDTQTHAVVFYDIADKDYHPFARMIVYKKTRHDTWIKVLEDSTIVSDFAFRYRDWNGDGIKDLSYVENGWNHGGHGPITWWLWLIDKNGIPHRVKGFDDLNDPRRDSYTHHIFTNIEGHTYKEMAEYKFSGNRIIKTSDDMVIDYDHDDTLTYYRKGKVVKQVKLKPGQQVYTPKREDNDLW